MASPSDTGSEAGRGLSSAQGLRAAVLWPSVPLAPAGGSGFGVWPWAGAARLRPVVGTGCACCKGECCGGPGKGSSRQGRPGRQALPIPRVPSTETLA